MLNASPEGFAIMKTSEAGRAFIRAHEGLATVAYLCPAGTLTIGYGHTSAAGAPKVTAGMTITAEEADRILAADLVRFEARVDRALGAVPQSVFDGAVSFDFNCGAIDRASWVGAYCRGDFAGAETALKSWNKGGGKVLPGLVRRREEEADMIVRGRYPSAPRRVADRAPIEEALARLGYTAASHDANVRAFQRDADLRVDGKVGPATTAALDRAMAQLRDAGRAAGAGALGAAGAGTLAAQDPSAFGLETLVWLAGGALLLVLLAWLSQTVWRRRGPLFAWLPDKAVALIRRATGVTLGRRIPT